MDAPMPAPVNPPALVRRWCDANGCYVVRGFVNPPTVVPKAVPMPMAVVVEAPMPLPKLVGWIVKPFHRIALFVKAHRPRLFVR
jgi:hypothetical protein